jgi:hypothetical protein
MFGHIHKLNSMGWVAQEGRAAGQRLQHTRLAFLAQVVADRTTLGNQPYQAFRLMGVQLVGHEQPDRVRVGIDGLGDMGNKVGFRAPWTEAGCHDLPTHDIEVGDQAQRAVADIFKLAAFLQPTLHWFGFRDPFKRLNTGHLITTHDMPTQAVEQRCIGIDGTDARNLVAKGQRVGRLGFRIQPVATTVWVQIGLALKTARLNGLKSWAQSLV